VAMTRAQTWLVVCGAGKAADAGWHQRIAEGVAALGALPLDTALGEGLRLQHGTWAGTAASAPPDPAPPAPEPPWLRTRPPAPALAPTPLAPSDLGGAKTLPGEATGDETALRRGRQIHRLLEHLPASPRADWPALAPALLAQGEDPATPAETALLLVETDRILTAPDLADLFAPDALAEVPFTCPLAGGLTLEGTIDRLLVTPARVRAVDFKTNATVPDRPEDVPEGLLRQMGAYAAALALIFPDRPVETAILWTRTARLMPLPHGLVTGAFRRATAS
jgi:ATP-dependent helicase/nuclease subunit A